MSISQKTYWWGFIIEAFDTQICMPPLPVQDGGTNRVKIWLLLKGNSYKVYFSACSKMKFLRCRLMDEGAKETTWALYLCDSEGGGAPKDPQLSKSQNPLSWVFISDLNVSDFSNSHRQDLTENFETNFWGFSHFGPSKAAASKMRAPALPMSPLFYFRILFYSNENDTVACGSVHTA